MWVCIMYFFDQPIMTKYIQLVSTTCQTLTQSQQKLSMSLIKCTQLTGNHCKIVTYTITYNKAYRQLLKFLHLKYMIMPFGHFSN